MEVAMTQAVAIWHFRDCFEQCLFVRLVEKCACRDVSREPDLKSRKLDRLMTVNSDVESHHAFKISGNIVRVAEHLVGERLLRHMIKHYSPSTSDLMDIPNSRNGKSQRLHGCARCCLMEGCSFCRR